MAWFAELKRRHWYCINQWDAISWYREYLYDTWYASLTDEQKAKLEEQKRIDEEKRKRKFETNIADNVCKYSKNADNVVPINTKDLQAIKVKAEKYIKKILEEDA